MGFSNLASLPESEEDILAIQALVTCNENISSKWADFANINRATPILFHNKDGENER